MKEIRFTLSSVAPQEIKWGNCEKQIEKLHALAENKSLLRTQAGDKINDKLEEKLKFVLLKLKQPILAGRELKNELAKKLQRDHGLILAHPAEIIMFDSSLFKKITKVLTRSEIVVGTMSFSKSHGEIDYYPLTITRPFKEKRYFFSGVESLLSKSAFILVREPSKNDYLYNGASDSRLVAAITTTTNTKKNDTQTEKVLFETPPFPAPMAY